MDAANVLRLMSLIPERGVRIQSGSPFTGDGSARMELVRRFLHWLGPLESLSKEEQQLLGVRAGGAKTPAEGEEASEAGETEDAGEAAPDSPFVDEVDSTPIRHPGAGTQIAA